MILHIVVYFALWSVPSKKRLFQKTYFSPFVDANHRFKFVFIFLLIKPQMFADSRSI